MAKTPSTGDARAEPDATLAGLPLHVADDAHALAGRLARHVAERLREGIEARGSASLAVSGGSTPPPMFDALAREPLDWSRVGVTLADERAVGLDDPASNEAMVRERLLVHEAAPARMVGLHRPDGDLVRVAGALGALARPFDVVILGMGGDGHTASLFPDAPELEAGLGSAETVLAMHPTSAEQARTPLTRHALLEARELLLHVTGAAKRAVLEGAMDAWRERGDVAATLPIGRVLGAAAAAEGGPTIGVWWAP